jgi:hypothetical protein
VSWRRSGFCFSGDKISDEQFLEAKRNARKFLTGGLFSDLFIPQPVCLAGSFEVLDPFNRY